MSPIKAVVSFSSWQPCVGFHGWCHICPLPLLYGLVKRDRCTLFYMPVPNGSEVRLGNTFLCVCYPSLPFRLSKRLCEATDPLGLQIYHLFQPVLPHLGLFISTFSKPNAWHNCRLTPTVGGGCHQVERLRKIHPGSGICDSSQPIGWTLPFCKHLTLCNEIYPQWPSSNHHNKYRYTTW